ncbi:GNAT family N-acetyltransferase [Fulvivirga sp. M361]|uniref:GNAT family N-acetyltransferase n=1 Tax=Fulvivirga sp. M361 TaxID=2594266 RepID=UPI00117BCD7F|nr:GNAT family N-acetyltransferase [Fulvivirga sp. M361]TRX57795.1 GNAT family N-acetyltransferase [Fulvivirga sp. M361]
MRIVRYADEHKSMWDGFVRKAKNAHFFFYRDYMEYHSERFKDFSLLFFNEKNRLIALLPANEEGGILYSHQGLTFGGFVVDDRITTQLILSTFDVLKLYLKANDIQKLVYKCMPYIYHIKPAEEDRYALFMNNAELIRRDVTSTIDLVERVRYSKGRKWMVNKAKRDTIEVTESSDYTGFWRLLTDVLASNDIAKPVHSLEEIERLAYLFPNNIKLYLAKKKEDILAGAVIYQNRNVVHTQYLANSKPGREIGALDLLLDHLIEKVFDDQGYFNFGISNENEGRYLNTGLIAYKEGFGAGAIVQDFYELEIK